MKELYKIAGSLVWLTQFGLSVAGPLVLCVLGAVWLQRQFSLGGWVVLLGMALGIGGAVAGLKGALASILLHA